MIKTLAAGAIAGAMLMMTGGSASAATPIMTGPFSLTNSVGTIPSFKAYAGNTYDFTFTTLGDYRLLSQLEASSFAHGSEDIDFSLWSGAPGSGVKLYTSAYTTGPSLAKTVAPGSYYLEVGTIAYDSELVSGGIKLLSAVPEPSAWGLMLVGLGAIGAVLRRARRQYGVTLADAFKAPPVV